MLGKAKRLFTIGTCAGLGILPLAVLGAQPAIAAPNVSISITPNPAAFTAGQLGAYTIQVTNNDVNLAMATIGVSDTLPPGLTPVSLTPSDPNAAWTCTLGNLSCTNSLGGFESGTSQTFTLVVSVAATPPMCQVTNTATVSSLPVISVAAATPIMSVNDPTTITGGSCSPSTAGTQSGNITVINDNHSSATNTNTTTVAAKGGNAEAEANATAAIVNTHRPKDRPRHHHRCHHR